MRCVSVPSMRSAASGFLGAIAVVGASAYLAISAAALLGLAAPPGLERASAVAVVVVLALSVPRPDPGKGRPGALVGLILGLIGVVGVELAAGQVSIGAGQIGGAAGALVTIPLLERAWSGRIDSRVLIRAAVILIFAFVSIALVRLIIDGGALGHDESAYAVKARAWIAGTPDTGWKLHRAPANSILAVPVVLFTENEVPFRLIGALLAVGSLVSVGLVALRLGGRWAAIAAVAVVGASWPYLRRGSEYLTDIPSAGLLLLIVWLLLSVVREPDAHARRVIWVGPLVAAAFYMRYQSALSVLGIALAAAVVWPQLIRQLKRELIAAGGIGFAALLPHLVWSTVVTGSPWGVVLFTQDEAGRAFLGEGLVDYASLFVDDLAGFTGAVVMTVAIVWLLWKSLAGGRGSHEANVARFVVITVLVAVVPLGLVAHGEPRFVLFPVWLLIAVGSAFIVGRLELMPDPYRILAVALAVVLWLPLFNETVRRLDRNAEARGERFQVVVDASNQIERDGVGTCAVLTTYEPQVNWYSTCWTGLYYPDDEDLGAGRLQGDRKYALLFENGKRQPTGPTLERILGLGPQQSVPAAEDAIGDATIVEISSN